MKEGGSSQKPDGQGRDMDPHEVRTVGIGWGTLSLINAGLAQSKGRSGLGWWLASLLVGPLATFLIVVLPAAEKT